ncbi:hypothetical protein B0J13DRAFT_573501 [Dactylonectria estremocensis]|uniref:Uncharacterized protein n=1 Tax=Dactylonectria estremocensis TaxID=1079267 RepID=A0A9P9D8X3_9HYPO|nr:hypothetical protein B0J13DRAFT_573501 [Dactylonectria estremocensis]
MSFSQDSLFLTVPTTPSTLNLSFPAPSVASSDPPSIASIPAEKLSIWTFRYARGSEPEFRLKERSDPSGKSSNKRLHYCNVCDKRVGRTSESDKNPSTPSLVIQSIVS